MVLRNGQLKIGYLFWQKEEDQRKGFNIARTLTLPNTSCISRQFKDIQEVISLILHCKTMYCCQRTSPSTSTKVYFMTGSLANLKSSWVDLKLLFDPAHGAPSHSNGSFSCCRSFGRSLPRMSLFSSSVGSVALQVSGASLPT